eukprot:m.131669 g.131669  ORF g.131669 m.131669 type:complete len:259 (-) comp14796_c3_seq1:39-815(-)
MEAAKFTFAPVPATLSAFTAKERQETLQKWGMAETLKFYKFRFDQPFAAFDKEKFLKDFFNDPAVLSALQVQKSVSGAWGALGSAGQATRVVAEDVPCTYTSMEFFDRLYDCGVLRSTGHINGCIPDTVDGVQINNELAQILLVEDSEKYGEFTAADRSEFLFRLFSHLVVGGPLNQYDDYIAPYFDITKDLYKDLVTVSRDPATKAVVVTSPVVAVLAVDGLAPLFPLAPHRQNLCYISIHPGTRTVAVLYNAWVGD